MLNNKLKSYRTARKLSQTDVANAVGLSQGAISLWERGVTSPNLEQLRKLSELFGVPLRELVDEEQEVVAHPKEDKEDTEIRFLARGGKQLTPEQIEKRNALFQALMEMDDDELDQARQVIDIYHGRK